MNSVALYVGILIAFIVGAIIVAFALSRVFKRVECFDLVQGKLANSDSSIKQATNYLKITNEWSSEDGI